MKKILTGSNIFELSKNSEEDIISDDDKQLFKIFDDLVNTVFEYETNKTVYTLCAPEKEYSRHWFVNLKTRMMESFPAKLEVELLEEYDDKSYLCFAGDCHIIVKKSKFFNKVEN